MTSQLVLTEKSATHFGWTAIYPDYYLTHSPVSNDVGCIFRLGSVDKESAISELFSQHLFCLR